MFTYISLKYNKTFGSRLVFMHLRSSDKLETGVKVIYEQSLEIRNQSSNSRFT